MRWSTLVLALILLFGLYVEWPYLWMQVNEAMGLPVFDFGPLRYVGVFLICLSLSFLLYLTLLFKREGKGTPVPVEQSQQLIAKGPYRYTRNPMYLSHVMVWLGTFLYFGKTALLLGLLVGWMGFHILVVRWEEPRLRKQMGEAYEKYKKSVSRWF